MSKHEEAVSVVAEYLSRNRHIPPERDGWFSGYEIESGIKEDSYRRVRSSRIYGALDYLMTVEPPAVEDTWMLCDEDSNHITEKQYDHPEQPKGARRYYRALGGAADYVVIEVPSGNLDPAW